MTLRVHGPNNLWTLSVPLATAERVALELRNGRWATVRMDETNSFNFNKVNHDYHFNPELVVMVEIEDENVPF